MPKALLLRRGGFSFAGAEGVSVTPKALLLRRGGFSFAAAGGVGATPKALLLRRRSFFCRQKKLREKDRSRGKPFDVSPLEKPLFPATERGDFASPLFGNTPRISMAMVNLRRQRD